MYPQGLVGIHSKTIMEASTRNCAGNIPAVIIAVVGTDKRRAQLRSQMERTITAGGSHGMNPQRLVGIHAKTIMKAGKRNGTGRRVVMVAAAV